MRQQNGELENVRSSAEDGREREGILSGGNTSAALAAAIGNPDFQRHRSV
jgi:hypothetical protein